MKINFKRKKTEKKKYQSQRESLKVHCNKAWRYIKKHPGQSFLGISPRPWILLLGTQQSGKTTLLRGASLSISSPHNTPLDTKKPTKLVDWWTSKEAVFIDPSSDIALPDKGAASARWETLLAMIDRYRMIRPLHHVLLVIDLPTLTQLSAKTLKQLSNQLKSLKKTFKTIPVSLIISKCDTLEGFNALFEDMDAKERQQILGMLFSKTDREQDIDTAFEKKSSVLITQLKSHLLKRMHREQNAEKRECIYNFPSNLSSSFESIKTLIHHLPFNHKLLLDGVYFTSITDQQSYFVEDTFQAIIERSKAPLPVSDRYASERLFAFPITAALIFGFTLLWHLGYDQTIRLIDTVQAELVSTPNNIPKNLPWLSELNILSNVIETIKTKQVIRYQWLGLFQVYQINAASKKEYKTLLKTQFIPYIKSTLLSQIQLGMKGNELALFDALKTYLSISQASHYNKSIIMDWYQTYWAALYPKNRALQSKLQHHLFSVLASNQTLWEPDADLVKQAQSTLRKLPLSDLAFLELQGEYPATRVSIFSNGNLDGVSLKHAKIPSFFSTTHFKEIFSQKIPNIQKILKKGNWVLGTKQGQIISSKQKATITKKIRSMYLHFYTTAWADTITKIQLQPADNYDDVLQRINSLLDKKSGLTQLLKLVIGNAELNSGATNKSLIAVTAYLNKNPKSQYTRIQRTLMNLKNSIQRIKKSDAPEKASYLIAIERFKHNGIGDPIGDVLTEAKNNPEPIRSWLNTIAMSTWKITLNHTHTYLNRIWQTIVLPVYQNEIENRYPVFRDSRENISLKNFNDFFGPNGTIGAFFIYYLQPFVNTTQNYWTWRRLNGLTLNISQKTLDNFIRASIIQQMFFTDTRNKPSFRFILAPSSLSSNTKTFTLNVGGQIYTVHKGSRTTKQFFWPGPDPSFVSVQFNTKYGKNPTSTYNGPWSWFRMLDANTLKTTANPREFFLTIRSSKHTANFKIVTEHRVNPMVPGIIEKYRCTETLSNTST